MTLEIRSLHESFIQCFYKLIQLAKIHEDNNPLLLESIEGFMQVMGRLLEDDDRWKDMARNAREFCRTKFQWEAMVRSLTSRYAELISKSRKG